MQVVICSLHICPIALKSEHDPDMLFLRNGYAARSPVWQFIYERALIHVRARIERELSVS